jgi:hypothetical protein
MGRIRAECFICGLDFYQDEMVRHYRFGRLVDMHCADEMTHDDYMSTLELPEERRRTSEQPVTCQGGGESANHWYIGLWYTCLWRGDLDPCDVPPLVDESVLGGGESGGEW